MALTPLGGGREFDLIRRFLVNAREHPLVTVGPGDDAAVIDGTVISTDMSIEGVHFHREWLPPSDIGYRAVVAALSDLAAMAAGPVAALVSLAIPERDAGDWAVELIRGAGMALHEYDAVLAGGDVTRSTSTVAIDVVVVGKCERPVLRSAARPGDEIWVTGELGAAAAAVAAWLAGEQPAAAARARYAKPKARIREACWLSDHAIPGAMIDLSDGIAGDARHLAAASRCHLIIDAAALPVHPAADARLALSGGEDYELCFSARPGAVAGARDEFERQTGVVLTQVGEVTTGEGVEILNAAAESGFDHFRQAGAP